MNVRHLDLNLLRVFDAVYSGRSVVSAVQVLGMPQPVVEKALSTLRLALKDPLFVPASGGLAPTTVARTVGHRVASALKMLDGAMGGGEDFDPTTSSRRFPIFVSDICALDLVPQITNTVRRCAPGVHLDLQNLACDQVGPALATGRIEFAIGHFPGSTDSNRIRLFDDHYVLLLGRKHPLASQPVRRDGLARLCFVRVGSDFKVEDPLHQFALESNIRLTIPDATMLRIALAGSDLAAMLPSRMARRLAAGTSFRLIEINPQLSSFPISIRWKRPAEADSGSRWLHAVVRQLSLSNEDATVRRRRPMQPTHDY